MTKEVETDLITRNTELSRKAACEGQKFLQADSEILRLRTALGRIQEALTEAAAHPGAMNNIELALGITAATLAKPYVLEAGRTD